jgi:hypothetical protein
VRKKIISSKQTPTQNKLYKVQIEKEEEGETATHRTDLPDDKKKLKISGQLPGMYCLGFLFSLCCSLGTRR